ncbi:carboxypeptidase-like regulatory domain-containing protein [Gimesia sp.]|tara:strand:+ start:11843 stop:12292 length:450 start_codon:yes stop_codon:yes gene_type:complete
MKKSSALHTFRLFALIAFCIFLITLNNACSRTPGSDKPRGEISITITNGGDPVPEGQVDLVNEQTGEGGGGPLNESGTATIEMVAVGNYTLTVNPPPQEPIAPGMDQPEKQPKEYANIPEKVRKIQTSPLTVDVQSGTNEFSFDLKEIQ